MAKKLTKTAKEAEEIYQSIKDEYGISDKTSLAILRTSTDSYELMLRSQKRVDKDGLTVVGDRKQMRPHPLLSVVRDARHQFLMGLKHLNLEISGEYSNGK